MIKQYVKKPLVIEALQYDGQNVSEIFEFFSSSKEFDPLVYVSNSSKKMFFKSREETMIACKGDYIIKGVKGEFYPCKPDVFNMSYEIQNK